MAEDRITPPGPFQPAEISFKSDDKGEFEFNVSGAIGEIANMVSEAISQDPRVRVIFYLAMSDHLHQESKKISSLLAAASKNKEKGYDKN